MANSATKAAVSVIAAVLDAIEQSGPDGMPSGQLYAVVMASGMSLAGYTSILDTLKRCKLVTESPSHVLTYGGPRK